MKKFICSFLLLGCVLLLSLSLRPSAEVLPEVAAYYEKELAVLETRAAQLAAALNEGKPRRELQARFRQLRLQYKRLAPLTDHFNTYESKLLNGPALTRVEEDNPSTLLPPQGLQAIEEALFGKTTDTAQLKRLTTAVLRLLDRLQHEEDRALKFKPAEVWMALDQALIRLATLGITGFDSPLALQSLPEAAVTLEAIGELTDLFPLGPQKAPFNETLRQARAFVQGASSFNSFDRLSFLRLHLIPLQRHLRAIGLQHRWIPEGRYPLKATAPDLFDTAAFDLHFFSPQQRYAPTAARIALGERLFFETRLSANNRRSCGSCHQPQKAFTDGERSPLSLDGNGRLLRNTPTLWNSSLQTRQFYDARALTLETQLSDVLHNSDEMKGSLEESREWLQGDAQYASLFRLAYAGEAEPLTAYTIANAISSYVRSLTSLNSAFDRYLRGEEGALGQEAKQGFNLFAGKAKCATCHFIPLFNGLVPPQFTETEAEILGVPAEKGSRQLDKDEGKFRTTGAAVHRYAFKTPTLRNVALTAPYMHNGVYATLEEVIDFYNRGGEEGMSIPTPYQTLPSQPLKLSRKEQKALIRFLQALTDTGSRYQPSSAR
jgi:cytochrome c peroxidase